MVGGNQTRVLSSVFSVQHSIALIPTVELILLIDMVHIPINFELCDIVVLLSEFGTRLNLKLWNLWKE